MFKVGQKVVCVSNNYPNKDVHKLKIGEIYTIQAMENDPDGALHLIFFEVEYWAYYVKHFRPLDETFAESVLENIKEQIKEGELICM